MQFDPLLALMTLIYTVIELERTDPHRNERWVSPDLTISRGNYLFSFILLRIIIFVALAFSIERYL